jgi:hypothetical protein
MTYKEISQMIAGAGLPYAYYQFPEDTPQAPPFICFFFSQTDDVFADDTNYQRIVQLNIELYTNVKDFDLEASLEEILQNNNLTYYKEENYIDSEKLYQIAYEMEVMING